MGSVCGGGSKTTNSSFTATNTPNIPAWWQNRYNSLDSSLGSTGFTGQQAVGSDYLASLVNPATSGGAFDPRNSPILNQSLQLNNQAKGRIYSDLDNLTTAQGLLNNFKDTNNPNTVTGSVTAGAPGDVTAGAGADYLSSYITPLSNDYVDASLADYDAGVGRDFNALRAGNAGAFGNKRTGVAEGTFMGDAARGRASLSSGLRLNAFNTAAGLGQTDADRALTASSTNAANNLATNQFNAQLEAQRQQFNAQQADTADQRLLAAIAGMQSGAATGIGGAGQLAGVGTTGVNNATAVNAAGTGNATSLGQYGQMGTDQLLKLLGIGTAGIGNTTTGSSTSKQSGGGNLLGSLGLLASGLGDLGLNL